MSAVPVTGEVLLEAQDLQVHFGLRGGFAQRLFGRQAGAVKAVDGVSLQLHRGEVLGLVGESGSGKTTLARALLSLVPITGGEVRLGGQLISNLSERDFRPYRRQLQMVFQDPHASLNPSMPLVDAVGHPLRIHGITRDARRIRETVGQALERVGLAPAERYLDKYPSDLSGGQKQRAVLARAIILDPEVVVADEPVSMLDMSVRAQVLQLMLNLKSQLGLTYLYVTHDLATARLFCDRIAIMYLGRIVETGPTAAVFDQPRHPYTESLLKAIPVPDPSHRVPRDLPPGEIPDAAAPPMGCSFHPRCRRAFGPCGWESRDLAALLEARWLELPPAEFQADRAVVGDVARLAQPSRNAFVPAAAGHIGAEVAKLFEDQRRRRPDDRLWEGVASMAVETGGLGVEFHPAVDPVLGPIGGAEPSTQVACHLYREDLTGPEPAPPLGAPSPGQER